MRRVALLGLFPSILTVCLGPLAWGQIAPTPAAPDVGKDQGTELRLALLPDGVGGATVRAALPDGTPVDVRTLDPMVMRGVRLLPVVIPREAAAGGVRLELSPDKVAPADPVNEAARRCSRGFFDSMRPFLAGDPASVGALDKAGDTAIEGTYLIITAPAFREALEPLVQWKREKGLAVRVATTDETGVARGQIQSWIGNLYRNDPRPPQFVLLVGDVEDVPAFDFHGVVSDLPYAMQDGNDFLPDMLIGRLSVSDQSQAQTVVAKILRHESDPFREEGSTGADWMGRALVVGADYASSTPRAVSRWIRGNLLDDGFSRVDSVYFPPHQGSGTALIRARINAGVSLVTYRGWAYGPQGWQPPTFISDHVKGLTNDWMLPAVFSFVCLNNKFDEPECFGEAWLRAGTPEQPRGAVAFIGNGEHWSHTRFNDAMAIGAMGGIHDDGIRRLGDVLDYAKMHLLRQFPLEIPYASEGGESVEFYFHIYNLLGDPEMELWIGPPRGIVVMHPDTLDLGANQVAAEVVSNPGGFAVAGVRVALSQGDRVLGCAWTDDAGHVRVPVEGLVGGIPVKVTVTGRNCQPYRGGMIPAARPGRPGLAGSAVREDGSGGTLGNADGIANPGETVALLVSLRNPGLTALSGATASLDPWGADSVETASVSFPQIAPGATGDASAPFLVRLRREAEDGTPARFTLRVAAGGPASLLDLAFALAAPSLRYEAHHAGEGFVPGAETDVSVTVRNEGSVAANTVRAVLRSLDPELLTVVDSTADVGTLAPGAVAGVQTPFRVRASTHAAVGAAANLQLILTSSEGNESRTGFALSLGTADHTSPLGGSPYGYWAYDNSDTDYPDTAPLYQWTEISRTFGGRGTLLSLDSNPNDENDPNGTAIVPLSFPFRFYGLDYDRLKVSDNGWVSFDLGNDFDYYNWSMPTTYGDGAKLAAFWDNLYPGKKDSRGNLVGDGVYVWPDSVGHRLFIEWSRIGNTDQPATPPATPLFFTDLQTFQIVLHDPTFYPTPTGDGMIEFRYKQILNVDRGRMYSTVGIMDQAGSDGIQYTYSNQYPVQAAPLSPGLIIRWTTQPPRYVPFTLASFKAEPATGGVALSWEPVDERPRGAYRVYRAGEDGVFRPVSLPVAGNGAAGAPVTLDGTARGLVDATANPGAPWQYQIRSMDPVGRETVLGPFAYDPAFAPPPPPAFSLEVVGANPFRGASRLSWSLPLPCEVSLQIHAVDGRAVRTLLSGPRAADVGRIDWDGRDDGGRLVPAGIYWARLESGSERLSARLVLVR
jgi:hypothetical protein